MKVIRQTVQVLLATGIIMISSASGQVVPQEFIERLEQLEKRVLQLEEENAQLRGQQQVEAAQPESKEKTAAVLSAGAEGFSLKSADGDFQLKLRGLVHADSRFLIDEPSDWDADTFLMRRVRPRLDGTLYQYYDFSIQYDLKENKNELMDAYLDIRHFPEAKIRLGKFKPPVGLERMQSANNLLFLERALPTQLVPNRDLGVQVFGDLLDGSLSYALGVFNGVRDGANSDKDENDSKDVVGNVFTHPFRNTDIAALKGLGIGLGVSYGKQDGTLPSYKTTAGQTFFSYTKDARADGERLRLSPQAYYYYESFGIFGEYVVSSQEVRLNQVQERLDHKAWQVAASYVLTGEKASWRGVRPAHPLNLKEGTWGAWEVAARYSQLDVDQDAFRKGLASLEDSAEQAAAWAIGLNWYLNRNLKASLNYEQTAFDGGRGNKDREDEKVILTRVQVAF